MISTHKASVKAQLNSPATLLKCSIGSIHSDWPLSVMTLFGGGGIMGGAGSRRSLRTRGPDEAMSRLEVWCTCGDVPCRGLDGAVVHPRTVRARILLPTDAAMRADGIRPCKGERHETVQPTITHSLEEPPPVRTR